MDDFEAKMDELDRILNDPDVAMRADQVWSLLDEISRRPGASTVPGSGGAGSSPV